MLSEYVEEQNHILSFYWCLSTSPASEHTHETGVTDILLPFAYLIEDNSSIIILAYLQVDRSIIILCALPI